MARMPRLPREAMLLLALVLPCCGGGAPAKSATAAPSNGAGGSAWGGPISAPDDQRTVRALLRDAALGRPAYARLSCARFVVAMPALRHGLLQMDPTLYRAGVSRLAHVDTPHGPRRVPIMIFAGGDALLRLLGSPAFVSLAQELAGGYIRPASEQERRLVYRLVGGFDPGAKITVAQSDSLRVAFLLIHGHVFWMELISAWEPSEWALRPEQTRLACAGQAGQP